MQLSVVKSSLRVRKRFGAVESTCASESGPSVGDYAHIRDVVLARASMTWHVLGLCLQQNPFFRPFQPGSCAWLSSFLLYADDTCVLVCVCLCMCV